MKEGCNLVGRYRFAKFEIDLSSGELLKEGYRIKLQPQPFQVLAALLERPGEVVTREDLRCRVWPSDTYVDFDHSLNKAVNKIREALSDSSDHPRYLETMARRGYRFIAPVELLGNGATVKPPRTRRLVWTTAGCIAVAVLAGVGLALRQAVQGTPVLVTPLTTYPGHQMQPSFSPDGTRVAFAWDGPDGQNTDIYLKLIGPGDPVRLTTDPAWDFSPAWSPDGRWIAALRDLRQELAVLLIPSSGGPPREVTRTNFEEPGSRNCMLGSQLVTCGIAFFPNFGSSSMLTWSAEGKSLFTSARTAPDSLLAIVRINIETGEQEPVTSPPRGSAGDACPAVSPDGRTLAFLRMTGFATGDIYIQPLSDGAPPRAKPRRLTKDRVDSAGPPAWTRDGRELVFSSRRGGRSELWRLPVSGSAEPVRLAWASEDAYDVALSPQDHRLVYGRVANSTTLWKIPIESGKGGEPVRVTATTRRDLFPHYSPDGKRIVFQSDRSGVYEIWTCDEDGSNAVQLTSFGKGWSGSPRWSPDGRTIVFDSNVEGNWDIWSIRAEGGRPARLTREPTLDVVPSWSHDNLWVYFASRRTGRFEIWKMRPDGTSHVQVTTDGGWAAYESVDGRYLYYKNEGEVPLWRIPVEGGAAVKVIESVRARVFTPTGHGIYFAAGDAIAELRFLDFASGAVRVVGSIGESGIGTYYQALSPDGRWALCTRIERSNSNLMLVENFR